MKKKRLALLLSLVCLAAGSITASAETKGFVFLVNKGLCSVGTWTAVKTNTEQKAYITPTSIAGQGRIWVEVYDGEGKAPYTTATGIEPREVNVTKSVSYYKTGIQWNTYRIMACDSEEEITSNGFQVAGEWTP